MPTKSWSARECTVFLGVAPLTGIAKGDDAIMAEYENPRFLDPKIDKDGKNGMHVKETDTLTKVTIKMDPSATSGLLKLDLIAKSGQPIPFISGRNLHSATEAWSGQSAALTEIPPISGGTNPQDKTFVFRCITGVLTHGGPVIIPI